MKSYAIVIGINRYDDHGVWPDLQTPVPDALRAVEWLRAPAPAGGGVAVDGLILLLSAGVAPHLLDLPALAARAGVAAAAVEGLTARGAALVNIRQAAKDLAARVTPGGGRLFFVYCGHGAQYTLAIGTIDAIAPADISADIVDPLSVPGITQFFRELPLPEQFFIFDCCRNLFTGRAQPATLVPPGAASAARCDQYIIYATANGAVARDAPPSVLGTALQGLRGVGRAKVWDPALQQHVVRFNQLFEHVRQQFAGDPIQTPRQSGENSGLNPALAEPVVPQTQLRLAFRPGPPGLTALGAQVSLTWWDGRKRLPNLPVSATPLAVPVYPGTYDVQLSAPPPAVAPAQPAQLDIGDAGLDWGYDFTAAAVIGAPPPVAPPPAVPVPPPGPVPPPAPVGGPVPEPAPTPASPPTPTPTVSGTGLTAAPSLDDGPLAPLSFSFRATEQAAGGTDALAAVAGGLAGATVGARWEDLPEHPVSFGLPGSGTGGHTLAVRSDDRLAVLELLDASSAQVTVGGAPLLGLGELVCEGLTPGAYRARWVVPGGRAVEESVVWRGTEDQTVTVPAPPPRPSPLMAALLTRVGANPQHGLAEVSERVGAALFPGVSPLLALASAANKAAGVWAQGHGDRLRGLNLAPAVGRAADGRAELLLAIEQVQQGESEGRGCPVLDPDGFLARVEVRLSEPDEATEPAGPPLPHEPANAPGVAAVNLPGRAGVRWAWVRSPDGDAGAFAVPVLRGRTAQLVLNRRNDGRVRVSLFCPGATTEPDVTRQLDLAQRFLGEGALRYALVCLDALLDGSDPVAGCLGGHLLIRLREAERLGQVAKLMTRKYPGLPDAHVLLGRYHELSDRPDEARAAYETALGHGPPVLARNLIRLRRGAERLNIGHPRAALIGQVAERLLPGTLWTGWLPSYRAREGPDPDDESPTPTAFRGGAPVPPVTGERPMSTLTAAAVPPAVPPDLVAAFSPPSAYTPPASAAAPRKCYCSNQANAGPFVPTRPETQSVRTKAVGDFTLRWSPGFTINIGFMNSYPAVQSAVQQYAVEWLQYANLKFNFVTAGAHLAINTQPTASAPVGTFNAFHGRQCFDYFKQYGIPSMNLVFGPALPGAAEVRRLILHEFGHALSLAHEHMSPVRNLEWNWAALRARFAQYGWSDQMIQQQIVDVYQPPGNDVRATAFDLNSIMMYNFDAGIAWYRGAGQPFVTPINFELSPRDKVMVNMMYPAANAGALGEQPLTVGAAKSGSITSGGQAARYVFPVTAGTSYVLETGGSMPAFLSLLNKRNDPTGMWVEENGPIGFTPDATGDLYAEVRHTSPLSGTGDFTITVRAV